MNRMASAPEQPDRSPARTTPQVLLFDVNETLSDMAPIASRFVDVGAPASLAATWFASLLRDGFALTAAGAVARFAAVGSDALRVILHGQALDQPVDDAIAHVMDGFSSLGVHPDVPDGVRALTAVVPRLVTLSNGASSVAEQLFTRAGILDAFEQLLSVDDAGAWKPAAAAYAYAARTCAAAPADMLLVAVHPWDTDGAGRAGLQTAWINRDGGPYPDYFLRPTWQAGSLVELAALLGSADRQ